MGKIKLTLLLVIVSTGLQANAHIDGWFRVTGSLILNSKWQTDAELQGRWQNGLNNTNPLREKLLYSYRHWIYYEHSKTMQLGVSPFAYYTLYKRIADSADNRKPPVHEYRASVSAMFRQHVIGNLYTTDKTMLEYRVFDHADNILRLRNKLGLEYRINTMLTSRLFYEVLLNAAGVKKQHFFDHQRTGAGLECRMSKASVEIGYMHINKLPAITETTITENNFFVNFRYSINSKKISDK